MILNPLPFSLCHLLLGLGSILFAITVDSRELNITTAAESISPRQANEIIIAVPTVSSTAAERKSAASKKAAIISFEEDENASLTNNNVLKSSTPPTSVSLADACLKYQEKQKLAEEKSKPFTTDSTYERLHAEPINISTVYPNETDYIEPESPTLIKIINPVSQTYPSLSNSYDYKETDSNISKATDSSSFTSNTTTHSSNSPHNQVASPPSHSTSMSSSISSVHNTQSSPNTFPSQDNEPEHEHEHEHEHEIENGTENDIEIEHDSENANRNNNENKYIARIQEMAAVEREHISRIQELEERCVLLQDRVTALTL